MSRDNKCVKRKKSKPDKYLNISITSKNQYFCIKILYNEMPMHYPRKSNIDFLNIFLHERA